MKNGLFKIAAAAGLAFASMAPAQAATLFQVDPGQTSVSVVSSSSVGFTNLSAVLSSGVLSQSFTLNVGESKVFDFIDITIRGVVGAADVSLDAALGFSPPGGAGTSNGDGWYVKGLFTTLGALEWDDIAPITAGGATYKIELQDLAGFTFNQTTKVKATVTLISEVPEASTWALMIVGFGLVGGAVRLRRREDLALAA